MVEKRMSFDQAFAEVSASSSGGAPFLIAYGVTFLITGILSFFLPENIVALIAMFQGAVALPVAFWLERRMARGVLSPDNPLRSLAGLIAVSQALAIPALIVVYNLNPRAIPVVLAGLGGVHFLPYSWLHRTRLYIYMAAAVALGAFALQFFLGSAAFNWILIYMGALYLIFAPLVYREAAQLISQDTLAAAD